MKQGLFFLGATFFLLTGVMNANAQGPSRSSDAQWSKQQAILKDVADADFIIRVGDVDNLGFGWPFGFDPFCGSLVEPHALTIKPKKDDLPGFDRILLSSKYSPKANHPCGNDDYSKSYNSKNAQPVTYSLPTEVLSRANVKNATLQIFIDDIQSLSKCSQFSLYINGYRFVEGERILNNIEMNTGIGKLVSMPLTEEFFPILTSNNTVTIKLDEAKGTADGYAIDFIRLIVNRKTIRGCKGVIRGRVVDKRTELPVPKANVYLADKTSMTANEQGEFIFRDVYSGLEMIGASKTGYSDGALAVDVLEGQNTEDVTLVMQPEGKFVQFFEKNIQAGEPVILNRLVFNDGRYKIEPSFMEDLDKVAILMKTNPFIEIEISGHTSKESERGDSRSISFKRAKACKDYIIAKGIDAGRVIAIGYGAEKLQSLGRDGVNSAGSQRIEMRITKK